MSKSAFNENIVIITGASSGIGKALALQLADEGTWIAVAAHRIERLKSVAAECKQRGGRAFAVQTDVSDPLQCARLIDKTLAEYGRIDTLINNAGVTMWSRFEDLQDLTVLDSIMQVNYFGSVYCTYYSLPYLKKTKGRIVVVSSLTGKTGVPTRSGYAASKHALVGFFDTLRIEMSADGISVTIAYPDFVATETRARAYGSDGKPLGVSPVQEGRVMTADECARLILKASARRRREIVMGLRGRVGQYIRVFLPGLTDRIARRAIERGR